MPLGKVTLSLSPSLPPSLPPHSGLPPCHSAYRSTVTQRGKLGLGLGLRLTVADDLGRQADSVPHASCSSCLRLRTHPIAASRSVSQPLEPPVRRATRQEPTSLSQVGTLPNAHPHLKPKMTPRFRRDPAVPSGLLPCPDLVEGVGSLREHLSLRQRKVSTFLRHGKHISRFCMANWSHYPWKFVSFAYVLVHIVNVLSHPRYISYVSPI